MLLLLVVAAAMTRLGLAQAVPSDSYRYKWPYLWPTSAVIMTLPFQQEHGCLGVPATNPVYPYECVAAYDLVIGDGNVVSAHQGIVTVANATLNQCNKDWGLGVQVFVDNMKYGHLASIAPSVAYGTLLLQGDAIGTQGNTGNTLPPTCGVHLHWEFGGITYGSAIPTIDGGSASSSNSIIGEFSTAGATLRGYYINHGSWNSIGWTYNHCPGACTLNMTANLAWGRVQDFQHDPDAFGGQFATIHVANWDTSHAYRVDSLFWAPWAAGGWDANVGVYRPISMARQESGACPSGSVASCLVYQRFHLGYVWANTGLQAAAVFCPDVYPLPEGDGLVLGPDAQWVFSLVKNHTYEVRADIDGNGLVTSTEAQLVFAHAGQWCHP
jgi:murein DD-endopeptidase MepM/ murein hydrolase activator NlpD